MSIRYVRASCSPLLSVKVAAKMPILKDIENMHDIDTVSSEF